MTNIFGKIYITLLVIILLSGYGHGQTNIKAYIHTNYIGDNDTNNGFSNLLINISINKLGHMIYLEEYYSIDSSDKPKFVMSNRYYDNNVTDNNLSFQILRPFEQGGKFYSLVKGVVILDNKRVYEKWIKTVNGVNLTNEGDKIDYIVDFDKYEIDYRTLTINLPTTYKFTIPELAIYDVDVVSIGNEHDVPLRIILYKGTPIYGKRFPGAVYKYLDITSGTYKIKKIRVRYKIVESWINDSYIPEENINLFRWNYEDNKWRELKTNIIKKDDNYTYYESETNISNISNKFAIAGLRNMVRIVTNQTEYTENHTSVPSTVSENNVSIIESIKNLISNLILKMK